MKARLQKFSTKIKIQSRKKISWSGMCKYKIIITNSREIRAFWKMKIHRNRTEIKIMNIVRFIASIWRININLGNSKETILMKIRISRTIVIQLMA